MSEQEREALPVGDTLSEENLISHSRSYSPPLAASDRDHDSGDRASSLTSQPGDSSSTDSSGNHVESVHGSMEPEEDSDTHSDRIPPPSPRPGQGSFSRQNNRVENNTTLQSLSLVMRSAIGDEDEVDYGDDELEGEDHWVDYTSPVRSPSRAAVSRPSLTSSFSQSFRLEEDDEEEERGSDHLSSAPREEESQGMSTIEEKPEESEQQIREMTSPISTLSISTTDLTLPIFPTKTPYDILPDLKNKSTVDLSEMTNLLTATWNLTPWPADLRIDYLEVVQEWRVILAPLRNVSTPVPLPIPAVARYRAPRYGDKTYAFTRLAINGAYQVHQQVAHILNSLAYVTPEVTNDGLAERVKDIHDEHERFWGYVMTAWESDKANEVKGSSWCYGEVDWKRGVNNPLAVRWVGGKKNENVEAPVWPGDKRDDLLSFEERRGRMRE